MKRSPMYMGEVLYTNSAKRIATNAPSRSGGAMRPKFAGNFGLRKPEGAGGSESIVSDWLHFTPAGSKYLATQIEPLIFSANGLPGATQ